MFFTCPVGSEDTCRLAWADLKKTIGTSNCAGYGEYYKAPGTIRDEGTALATPDAWVIGTGVYATPYAGGTCDLLKKVADPAGDAGPGDSGPSDTGTKTDSGTTPPANSGTTPPADSGTTPADSGGTSGDTGSGGPASNSSKDSGGCSVGAIGGGGGGAGGVGFASGAGSVFGLAAMLLAVVRRRRNRA